MGDLTYTQEYRSTSESEEDEFEDEEPKAKRRKIQNRKWTEREEFPPSEVKQLWILLCGRKCRRQEQRVVTELSTGNFSLFFHVIMDPKTLFFRENSAMLCSEGLRV